jgi:hypothetical protein
MKLFGDYSEAEFGAQQMIMMLLGKLNSSAV